MNLQHSPFVCPLSSIVSKQVPLVFIESLLRPIGCKLSFFTLFTCIPWKYAHCWAFHFSPPSLLLVYLPIYLMVSIIKEAGKQKLSEKSLCHKDCSDSAVYAPSVLMQSSTNYLNSPSTWLYLNNWIIELPPIRQYSSTTTTTTTSCWLSG